MIKLSDQDIRGLENAVSNVEEALNCVLTELARNQLPLIINDNQDFLTDSNGDPLLYQ